MVLPPKQVKFCQLKTTIPKRHQSVETLSPLSNLTWYPRGETTSKTAGITCDRAVASKSRQIGNCPKVLRKTIQSHIVASAGSFTLCVRHRPWWPCLSTFSLYLVFRLLMTVAATSPIRSPFAVRCSTCQLRVRGYKIAFLINRTGAMIQF